MVLLANSNFQFSLEFDHVEKFALCSSLEVEVLNFKSQDHIHLCNKQVLRI